MANGSELVFSVQPPDLAAAGTAKGAIAKLPYAMKLQKCDLYITTANNTGSGAALTALVKNGSTTLSASLVCHVTDDAQALSFVFPQDADLNCDADDTITVEVTGAGGSTVAATDMQAHLVFGRPMIPT